MYNLRKEILNCPVPNAFKFVRESYSTGDGRMIEMIKSIFPKNEFFEIREMAWWSFDRLKEVVKNRGRYKDNKFRKRFVSALSSILSQFEYV